MEYVQLSMDEYIQSKNDIKNNLGGIVKSFVRIGWQLTRIDRSGAYKNDGYSSIAEFAAAEYGMTRTGVSRFMNVYETYSADGDTPELKEQYRDFNFSQLTELLQIQEADRQMFTPEVKREDIREFQRFEKENEADPARLLDWKDAKSPEEKLKATIQEFCRENKDILNAVYSSITEPKDLAEMISVRQQELPKRHCVSDVLRGNKRDHGQGVRRDAGGYHISIFPRCCAQPVR